MDKQIRSKARAFLIKNGLSNVDSEGLKRALKREGFTVVRFNHIQNTDDVENLIHSLRLQNTAAHAKAFTYADANFRLVFAHEGLTESELLHVLAHEAGHICCGYLSHLPVIGQDVKEETEAHDFASYVLKKHPCLAANLWIRKHKAISVIMFLSIIVLLVFAGKQIQSQMKDSYWSDYYVTATGEKYHQKDCIFVKGKSTVRRLTQEELESGIFAPCQVCLPEG